MPSIYDFSINSLQGNPINFADFKGKVLLFVNTASKCGFTPQYTGLEALHEKYKDDLIVVGFPCNQFGAQEPGDATQIQNECLVNYGVTFLITEKIEVNGENAHPIFKYIKSSLPGILGTEDIKWNFTKFLVDKEGNPVERFSPDFKPEDIEPKIQEFI